MKVNKIAFVGAGAMAEAIIAGLLKEHMFHSEQLWVSNRSNNDRLKDLKNLYNVQTSRDKQLLLQGADIVFLAMKPKDAVIALKAIKPFIHTDQLIISVLAGVSTTSICDVFQDHTPVIRVMPNTSAAIGCSATALSAGEFACEDHIQISKTLFQTIGTVTIMDEDSLHAVTGLSGSGPAYIYYLIEAMEKAGMQTGLTREASKELILQTIIGAAEMLKTSMKSPSQLRNEVTSSGGTTEAGLKILKQYQFQEAIIKCIEQAAERSAEMGKQMTKMIDEQTLIK
jgi:pyrroline-5-carboxylate reductase